MKQFYILTSFVLLAIFNLNAQTLNFDEPFATRSWAEDGYSWSWDNTGWDNIRSYNPHSGSGHAMSASGYHSKLSTSSVINIDGVWIETEGASDFSHLNLKGFDNAGNLIYTQALNPMDYEWNYAYVTLNWDNVKSFAVDYDQIDPMDQVSLFYDDLDYSISTNAQTVADVVTGVIRPWGLLFVGNDLYISEIDANKISKIDITESVPTITDVVTGVDNPRGLVLVGNDLYFSSFDDDKISKIDITESTPTITDVVTGIDGAIGLALNGNDLYIASYFSDKISKIDISQSTPTITDVITGINGPTGIMLSGNELYIASHLDDKISKIDITESTPTITDVVTGVNRPSDILLIEDELFITERNGDKISKVDISQPSPTATNYVTNLNTPSGMILSGDDIYVALRDENKIVKITDNTLSVEENLLAHQLLVFPNPSSEFIQVSGLIEGEKYILYNILGARIKDGIIYDNQQIDIRDCTNGLYFMKFDNGNTLKFIKE